MASCITPASRVAAACLLLLHVATGAVAAGVMPHTPAAFSKYTIKDYLFSFKLPQNNNAIISNGAKAFATAGFSEIVFPMAPCSGFIPHFHPHAAETMLVIQGHMNILQYNQQINKVFHANLDVNEATVIAPNTLHYYYNARCSEATIVSVLNSNAPGIQIYYDITKSITSLQANAFVLNKLINTHVSNSTFDASKAFFALTNDCKAKCKQRRG